MKKIQETSFIKILILNIFLFSGIATATAQYDSSFYSNAFETERWYRIYLPSDYYSNPNKAYPVVYYFHGYGGRYKWDEYDLDYDPGYPGNGRVHPLYVMEWREYAASHDIIIVTWDGYEPNLHPGQKFREGIKYGWCPPYDYPRAHEKNISQWGWDYRPYFRELVGHIDSNYRTIADRDHRAITGLSMGGLTALYISGQNKDLISSMSAFCPADNIPMYGPKGYLSVFPVLEMYRSLDGLSVRLTANDGDWLFANDLQMNRIIPGSGLKPYDYHLADFPDHGVADADLQLDFHMKEFEKTHPNPDNWNHICPSFLNFSQWGYHFSLNRPDPALTVVENVSKGHMKVFGRKFIPDGPMVMDEAIHVETDKIYTPSTKYDLVEYNLTSESFSSKEVSSSETGSLGFTLPGGGNIVGISGDGINPATGLRIINKENYDYLYFEEGKVYALDLDLVNVSTTNFDNITIKAFSNHPYINFSNNELTDLSVNSKEKITLDKQIIFAFNQYNIENLVGNIQFEISVNGVIADTQKIVFFTTPVSPYVPEDDVIILDGRTEYGVPVFNQGSNSVRTANLSGGTGNGNGIAETGEEILVYIKLKQGLSPNDKNSFHKTYLIGDYDNPYIQVKKLKYDEKMDQAASTSISTYFNVGNMVPETDSLDLWFRIESLYNDNNVPASRRVTYEYHYDYRRIKVPVRDSASSGTGKLIPQKYFKLEQNFPNPVNNYTSINFSTTDPGNVKLDIIDLQGREVKVLINENKKPGSYSVSWDRTNNEYKPCNAGVYLYRLMLNNNTRVKRMTLL